MRILNTDTNEHELIIQGVVSHIPAGSQWDVGLCQVVDGLNTYKDNLITEHLIVHNGANWTDLEMDSSGARWLYGMAAALPLTIAVITLMVVRRGYGLAREY